MHAAAHAMIPDQHNRLVLIDGTRPLDTELIVEKLRQDLVVLVRGLSLQQGETAMGDVAEKLGLLDRLKFQAAYATAQNRERVGEYNMTVNKRRAYQFIQPHSEGDSAINVQLASFYCLENSTDGGETILLNVDDSSDVWPALREKVVKMAPQSRALSRAELMRARGLYHLDDPPSLADDDRIIGERESAIPGLSLLDVLAKARKTYSSILGRDVFVYWSTIAIFDRSALEYFASLLKECDLLRQPAGGMALEQMDNVHKLRIWSSDVDHRKVFKSKIVCKLMANDFVCLNNLTWTHSVSNWTPESGLRRVVAAFA